MTVHVLDSLQEVSCKESSCTVDSSAWRDVIRSRISQPSTPSSQLPIPHSQLQISTTTIEQSLKTMASTQTPPKELSPQDYVRIFKEANDLYMPPFDFRVWDRYLFSRCSDNVRISGLLRLFRTTIKYLQGSPEQNIQTVGQWCEEGTFFDKAKNVIDSTVCDLICLDFLGDYETILKAKPLGLSEVQDIHQTAWFEQAKDCVKPIKEIENNQERREAYFAFGLIVWGIMPEPSWVMEDASFDVWYKLGFAVAHQPEQRRMLFEGYQKQYSETCGVSETTFESFFHCFSNRSMFDQLQTGWDTTAMTPWFRSNLEIFLLNKEYSRQSVWRLHHWTFISNEVIEEKMEKTKVWGVFDKARKDYALTQEGDINVLYRKKFWTEVLGSLIDPLELHYAMQGSRLNEFLKTWCADHRRSETEADKIYPKNPKLPY